MTEQQTKELEIWFTQSLFNLKPDLDKVKNPPVEVECYFEDAEND